MSLAVAFYIVIGIIVALGNGGSSRLCCDES